MDLDQIDEGMTAYAAAVLSLNLQVLSRGGSVPIREVEATLCEDGRTVMLMADHDQGCAVASFVLPAPVAEEDFDSRPYSKTCARAGLLP